MRSQIRLGASQFLFSDRQLIGCFISLPTARFSFWCPDADITNDKIDAGEIDIDRIKDMSSLTAFKNRLDEVCALTISSQSLIDQDI
jgi:hypothetical protein